MKWIILQDTEYITCIPSFSLYQFIASTRLSRHVYGAPTTTVNSLTDQSMFIYTCTVIEYQKLAFIISETLLAPSFRTITLVPHSLQCTWYILYIMYPGNQTDNSGTSVSMLLERSKGAKLTRMTGTPLTSKVHICASVKETDFRARREENNIIPIIILLVIIIITSEVPPNRFARQVLIHIRC